MIGNYIHQLLFESEKLIIPEFGTFIFERIASSIHPTTHVFVPASKKFSFEADFNIKDAQLVNFIISITKQTKKEANNDVSTFINAIKDKIKQTKTAEIKNVGTFIQASDNKIVFEQNPKINFLTDSFGMQEFESPAVKKTKNKKEAKKKTKKVKEETVAQIPKAQIKDKPEKEKKKKCKMCFWLFLLIFLFVIASGIAVWYVFQPDKVLNIYNKTYKKVELLLIPEKNDIAKQDVPVAPTINIVDDSLLLNQDSIEDINNEDIDSQNNIPTDFNPTKGKVYIIGNAFKNKENADNYVKRLKDKNYQAFIVDKLPSGLYRISYGEYDDLQQAKNELQKIKANDNPKAWILKKSSINY